MLEFCSETLADQVLVERLPILLHEIGIATAVRFVVNSCGAFAVCRASVVCRAFALFVLVQLCKFVLDVTPFNAMDFGVRKLVVNVLLLETRQLCSQLVALFALFYIKLSREEEPERLEVLVRHR